MWPFDIFKKRKELKQQEELGMRSTFFQPHLHATNHGSSRNARNVNDDHTRRTNDSYHQSSRNSYDSGSSSNHDSGGSCSSDSSGSSSCDGGGGD